MFSNTLSTCICLWQNLRIVECSEVVLDVDALVHLSRMPTLTQLTFRLNDTLPDRINPSDSPISFSRLHELTLHFESLDTISRLLSQTRLQGINLDTFIENRPSRLGINSFLASVQTSVIGHTILRLRLVQDFPVDDDVEYVPEDSRPTLVLEHLRPFTAYTDLRRLDLNIDWNVDLKNSELLELASAWPHLEYLMSNEDWGWKTQGGITPNGLLQLLQTCPSLDHVALAMDTRGYTECSQSPASLGLTFSTISINVVDSVIEPESVSAIAAFLANLKLYSANFSFFDGDRWQREGRQEWTWDNLWYEASKQSEETVGRILDSFGYRPSESDDLEEVKSRIRGARVTVNQRGTLSLTQPQHRWSSLAMEPTSTMRCNVTRVDSSVHRNSCSHV